MITSISNMTIRELAAREKDLIVSIEDLKAYGQSARKRGVETKLYLREGHSVKIVDDVEEAFNLGQKKAWQEMLEFLKCDGTEEDCSDCVFYDYNNDEGQLVEFCRIKAKQAEMGCKNE